MSTGKKVTYTKEFKEKAVRLYLEGFGSYRELVEQLDLKDTKTLRSWVAKVRNGDPLDDGRGKSRHPRKGRPKSSFNSIEEELAYYKAESAYLKKLYRSRFGHEWGAHLKDTSSK